MIPCGRKSGEVTNALVVTQPVERMSADISTMDEYFSLRGQAPRLPLFGLASHASRAQLTASLGKEKTSQSCG